MKEVIIRDVEMKDLSEIKVIIGESWKSQLEGIVESESTYKAALGLYLHGILQDSSFGRVATVNNKVVGLIFGSFDGHPPKFRMMQEDLTEHTLTLMNASDQERKDITEFMSKIHHTYEQLIHDTNYDGFLNFFVVSEEARGLRIGKQLWNELSNYFKENQAQSIYLYTDTACNVGFYDYNGFSKRKEQEVTLEFTSKEDRLDVFLYDYQFND